MNPKDAPGFKRNGGTPCRGREKDGMVRDGVFRVQRFWMVWDGSECISKPTELGLEVFRVGGFWMVWDGSVLILQ